MSKKIILMVIAIVVIRGIGYATFTSLNLQPLEPETMTIKVYLLNRIIPKTVVETTLKQFPTVDKVIFAIDGKPVTFYEWMQIGCYEENNFCDETPFKTSLVFEEKDSM
jgi:hypothetical protein